MRKTCRNPECMSWFDTKEVGSRTDCSYPCAIASAVSSEQRSVIKYRWSAKGRKKRKEYNDLETTKIKKKMTRAAKMRKD